MNLSELYKRRDVIEKLGNIKNDVDALRSMLKRISKLRKQGEPLHHFFHPWILRNAKDLLQHATEYYNLIEKEEQ